MKKADSLGIGNLNDAGAVIIAQITQRGILGVVGLLLSAVFTFGCMYFTSLFFWQCYVLRRFRGPLAIPLVGNCYQSEALYLLRYLSRLRKRFGKIFTFFAFTKPYLVVCDPLAVRRILSDTKAFVKGVDYTNQFSVAFGQGLVTSNGERHRKDRATFGKYFIRSNICKYISMVNVKSRAAIAQMLGGGGSAGQVHNIEHFFALLSLRVFMAFSIGYDFGERPQREEELCKAVSNGSWAIGRMITLGLPMWDIFPAVAVIRTGRAELWEGAWPPFSPLLSPFSPLLLPLLTPLCASPLTNHKNPTRPHTHNIQHATYNMQT